MNYTDVQKLFGTPLKHVATPQVPFKLKPWHVVAGAIAVGFVICGVNAAYKDLKKKFNPVLSDQKKDRA